MPPRLPLRTNPVKVLVRKPQSRPRVRHLLSLELTTSLSTRPHPAPPNDSSPPQSQLNVGDLYQQSSGEQVSRSASHNQDDSRHTLAAAARHARSRSATDWEAGAWNFVSNHRDSSTCRIEVNHNGKTHLLDALLLRDACCCEQCIEPSTTQKRFDTTDIPLDIRAKEVQVNGDGSFSIWWENDIAGFKDHHSLFAPGILSYRKSPRSVEAAVSEQYPRVLWHRADLETIEDDMTVRYDDYMSHGRALSHVIQQLLQYGIAFILDVPHTTDSVASIGNRIGPLMNTIYGSTWDVRAQSSAKNVADTSSDLAFHMDLLYYKEPPRLQILHFLKQSREGGESLFSDSWKAVFNLFRETYNSLERLFEKDHGPRAVLLKHRGHSTETSQLRELFQRRVAREEALATGAYFHKSTLEVGMEPEDWQFEEWKALVKEHQRSFGALMRMRRPFHYRNNNQWLEYPHQMIVANKAIELSEYHVTRKLGQRILLDATKFAKEMKAVRWSPPFQAPLPLTWAGRYPPLDDWVRGLRRLKTEFERKEAVFESRMAEGTCVIFDNWRILHARKAFSGGERWLRGAYIDDVTFRQQVVKLDNSET